MAGGTNLDGQLTRDRDALFVQDFPLVRGVTPAGRFVTRRDGIVRRMSGYNE